MNNVMDLTDNEILTILRDLQWKGKSRADIMLELFEIDDISKECLPSDIQGKENYLKKVLMSCVIQGWI